MLSNKQVAALYVAVYNRAPDAAGLNHWMQASTYTEAAQGFVAHAKYADVYGGLSNQEKVEAFYQNMLGGAGDEAGITYWTEQLDSGMSDAEFLAEFLDASLNYDGDDAAALTRKATLTNKVDVGIYYAETLGAASNIPADADLNTDPAYLQSIAAIAGVTADAASVNAAQNQINEWAEEQNPDVPANTQNIFLTEGADRDANTVDGFLKGSNDANTTFIGDIVQNQFGQQVNTLGTGDRLDGGNGANVLDAQVTQGAYAGGNTNMAIQAQTKNIQEVNLEAVQSNAVGASTVFVNAKDMQNVNYIGSQQSNASLVIQDLTSKGVAGGTADMTIGMKYTNNADTLWNESDLQVYFDQDYLLRNPAYSEPRVDIRLMNEDAYSATDGEYPLAGVYLRELTITLNGTRFDLTQYIDEEIAGDGEEIRTYSDLLEAIQGAIVDLKAANADNAALQTLQAKMGPLFAADIDPQNNQPRIGESITLTVDGETNGETNELSVSRTDLELGRVQGTKYENNNRYERAENDPVVASEDLVTINVDLEKVGRAADGGELVIGSMNKDGTNTWQGDDEVGVGTVSGVERFNVTVSGDKEQSSSLSQLRSTNNHLREVNIVSAEGSDANLTIGNSNTAGVLGTLNGNAAALKDVKTLNAAGFNGDLDVNAALTGEVTDKYLADTGSMQQFQYTGGTGNDSFNVALSAENLAASGNTTHGRFSFELDGGVGNDTITVGIYDEFTNDLANPAGGNAPWYLNQLTNSGNTHNLKIDAGEGDDAVNLQGSGEWSVDLGAGNDVIYVDNAGGSYAGAAGTSEQASWIFNAVNPNAAIYSNVDGWTNIVGGGNPTQNLYKAGVDVVLTDDKGGQYELYFALNTNSNYQISQKSINEQIKFAIENDATFSKLLEVSTGQMADTLIIDSLIDGDAVNLAININQLAAGSTQAQIDNFNAWYGADATTNGLTNAYASPNVPNGAAANAPFGGANTAQVTGSDGDTYGQQAITGGKGDDIFVLATSANQVQALVYEGYDNGHDTIINMTNNTNLNVRDYNLKGIEQGTYANIAAKQAAVFANVTSAQDEHVILFNHDAVNTGEYTVEVWKQDATSANDVTLVGTIGTLDFGQAFVFNLVGDTITV